MSAIALKLIKMKTDVYGCPLILSDHSILQPNTRLPSLDVGDNWKTVRGSICGQKTKTTAIIAETTEPEVNLKPIKTERRADSDVIR